MKITGLKAEWDGPRQDPAALLVLAHGAGGDLHDHILGGIARSLAEDGVAIVRFNFPYRDAGRRAPGSQKESDAAYRSLNDAVRADDVPLFCGGKSYGGRMATHIAAGGYPMSGLVLLSYPLHPPGRPERLRDAHLGAISAPMLFVQGTRDPFATPELLTSTIASLAQARLVRIDGGDHSLRVRGRTREDVLTEITAAVRSFVLTD